MVRHLQNTSGRLRGAVALAAAAGLALPPAGVVAGTAWSLLDTGWQAGGWQGAPVRTAPGFPDDTSWKVSVEGIRPLL